LQPEDDEADMPQDDFIAAFSRTPLSPGNERSLGFKRYLGIPPRKLTVAAPHDAQ
jgi:hypothetical protein